MPAPQFDPQGFFEFDMKRGAVRVRDGQRVLVTTEDVLESLLMTAVHHGDLTAVRKLGGQLGAMVSEALGEGSADLPVSKVLEHAAGTLAVFGWGRLRFERWGPALALVVDDAAPLDEDRLAMAALLGGLLSTLAAREVACVPMEDGQRYLVVDPSIAEQVWLWSREGDDLPMILSHLDEGEAA